MRRSPFLQLLFASIFVLPQSESVWAWTPTSTNRRRFFLTQTASTFAGLLGGSFFAAEPVSAACMTGDLSPDCIGVYKSPGLSPTAPGASSFREAWSVLQAQRLAADDIATVVGAGRLEEAGIKVLRLISTWTRAGQVVATQAKEQIRASKTTSDNGSQAAVQQLMEQRIDDLFIAADVAWKSTDVGIGQGLRGELGAPAVAQIRILADIREATAAVDDFLAAVAKLE